MSLGLYDVLGNVTTASTPHSYYGEIKSTLWKVVPPFIMAIGLPGNFLTIVILTRQLRRQASSTAVYLLTLACSDSVTILSGPLRNWIKEQWHVDIRYLSDVGCKMQIYLTYASIHFSAWLLVAVTMERVVSVLTPYRAKTGCTTKVAAEVVGTIFIMVFSINSILPVSYGLQSHAVLGTQCTPTTDYFWDFRNYVWKWIDVTMSFFAPLLFLVIGNIIIIVALYKARSRRRRMISLHMSCPRRDTKSISLLLVALSTIFFLTVSPVTIFLIYYPYRLKLVYSIKDPNELIQAYDLLMLQAAVVNMIMYTNATFNFVLYVLSGSKFRNELKQMFRCKTVRMKHIGGDPQQSPPTKSSSLTITSLCASINAENVLTDVITHL